MSKIVLKFDSNTINFTGTVNYSINSCGGVMYGQQITITSPNYPKNYQQTTNCAWSLKLPEEKHVNVSILYLQNNGFSLLLFLVFSYYNIIILCNI